MQITTVVQVRGDSTALLAMMRRFNAACNALSQIAFAEGIRGWYPLQKRSYYWLRSEFGLSSAQATVVVRKVASVYTLPQHAPISFRPLGGIPVIEHWYRQGGSVAIYGNRCTANARPELVLRREMRQATLVHRNGRFYLHQPIEVAEPPVAEVSDYLGCDLGIVNILTDSDGQQFAGATLNGLRHRHARLRAKLSAKGTKSAKRLLKRRRHRETRFGRDVNHCISKQVVAKAKGTGRGIALEDLKGIRDRTTVRKAHRRRHHSWSFFQLRQFIEYKARLAGVPVVAVDPRNTSRTCPACGCIDKANRKSQAKFLCTSCGLGGHADVIAAGNIARRALGNAPYAAAQASCEAAGFTPHG